MATTDPQQLLAQSAACLTAAADSLVQAAHALSDAARALSAVSQNISDLPGPVQASKINNITPHHTRRNDIAHELNDDTQATDDSNAGNNLRRVYSDDEASSEGEDDQNTRTTSYHPQQPGAVAPLSFDSNAGGDNSASHWYIALQEDFDAIPLICYLAEKHAKTVCFISRSTTAAPYKSIFQFMSNRLVERPGHSRASALKAIDRFATMDSALLLLRGNTPTPDNYRGATVDAVIHWGLPRGGQFIPQIKSPNTSHTYILIPTDERDTLRDPVLINNGVVEHPESARLNAYGPQSPLFPLRDKAKKALSVVKPGVLQQIYGSLFHKIDPGSAIERAQRANRFAAKVILRGTPEDGSELYQPMGPRLYIRAKSVRKFHLEPAVDQGLINVINPN